MSVYGMANQIFNVSGKKAIVTGGARGLGREMSLCLLENGCDVFATSRRIEGNEEFIDLAAKSGSKLYLHSSDITNSEDVVSMIKLAMEKMGRIDILINAAGINILKKFTEMDDESFETVMRTNVNASFSVTREVAKVMKEQKYGKIINISSIRSMLGASDIGYSAYATSKAAINMLTKQVACELASDHITVNAIAPTFIKTNMNAAQLENVTFRQALEARIPVGRIGQFTDLMGLMLLLASDASAFITGQTILLDGGISARQ